MECKDAFKAIQTSEYGLCHFYQVGTMGDFPPFPKCRKPTSSNDVCQLLKKPHDMGQPNIVVALPQDAVGVNALLWGLHHHISLQRLKMQTDKEAGEQASQKLLFCPFCQYSGSNDQSYLNHIMCMHYCANYGCGKCLDVIFMSEQRLSRHMKKCKGLAMDAAKGKLTPKHTEGASPLSSKENKKHRKPHSGSQPDSKKDL